MHIIQIPSAAPSFIGIWAIRNPLKVHCYTCMSLETCWSRLIYTKLSSHRSFVINMYVITMAWRCISPWSFHRSLQRRREMNIFHICQQVSAFWSKNNPKKREKLRLNARKHCESESRNRNLSAAVIHVKPNKSAATFKKGIFVHPPWVPNCMQNLKGGWKCSFPKMFDSYRDLFLIVPLKSEKNWRLLIKENNEFW